jgi:polyhydroxybutyrate depolymerase
MLHGGGGNADNAEMMTGLTDKGRAEGFTVVYPNGTGGTGDSLLTWNAGHCCGSAIRNAVDDVGFIGAMLDDVLATFNIDPNRVFVTGMSNGAMMAHRVAYALSDRIAAIAPVVGAVFGDEATPATPVSMLAINGALDENVPPAGGTTGGRPFAWDGTPMLPSVQQGVWWATANGCEVTATAADHGAYVERQHLCPSGVSASTVIVKDNGHAWPGGKPGSRLGDTPSTTYNATDVIWAFFAAHPKHHP